MHAAAAIYGDVDVLLTRNTKHLRTPAVLAAGVSVVTSDVFLVDLLERRRTDVVHAIARAAAGKKNPPVTIDDLMDRVAAAGAPGFADRLRSHRARA